MNSVKLLGRLGRDPETRSANSGTAICTLSLATSEREKRGDQWQEHTEWHRVVAFGRTAELCGKYLSKGSQLCVEGKLRTRKWTDQSGQERFSTEIVADAVHFCGPRPDAAPASEQASSRPSRATARRPAAEELDDEIPFHRPDFELVAVEKLGLRRAVV